MLEFKKKKFCFYFLKPGLTPPRLALNSHPPHPYLHTLCLRGQLCTTVLSMCGIED